MLVYLFVVFNPQRLLAQSNTGINFLKGKSWADAISMAKSQKKMIFIDVFTDGCGPCKMMDEQVFPQPEVAKFYNDSFINIKIDAEKGEGIGLAKKYFVQSYPNYIFVNSQGDLVYRMTGYQEPRPFIEGAKIALAESKQTITLAALAALYPQQKDDKVYMFNYIDRLTNVRAPIHNLLEDYIALLNEAEQKDQKVIALIARNATFLNNQIKLGSAFNLLKNNELILNKLVDEKKIQNTSLSSITSLALENSLSIAIKEKNEQLLAQVVELTPSFKQNHFANKFTVELSYYLGTKDYRKFSKLTRDFITNYLLHLPMDSLKKWDARVYENVKVEIEKDITDKRVLEEELYQYRHTQTIQFCRLLAQYGEDLLRVGSTPSEFKAAKQWLSYALEIADTDKKYYVHVYPTFKRIYAIACYKTGQKELAIVQLRKVIAELPASTPDSKKDKFLSLLKQMEANEIL